MKTPTCGDIAQACGVSAATVSRALNNHPAIPAATRERVLAAARKMGWRPNPLASAFMAHLRSTRPSSFKALLGVLVDYPMPHGPTDLPSHVLRMYTGFKQRAAEYGYGVKVISLAEPSLTSAALGRTMVEWNIPGFLVTSMSTPGKVLPRFKWSRYAIVAIGYSMKGPAVHRVVSNVMMGVKTAIEKVLSMGYQRIGVVVPEEYDRRTNHAVMLPVSYMARQLRPDQLIDAFVYDQTDPHHEDRIADWLRQTRPELVMGMFEDEILGRLGWRVPQDIARVTFDRSPGCQSHAGLEQRYEVLGGLAADVLISEITLNRRGLPENPVEYTTTCKWVNSSSALPRVSSTDVREA